MLGRGIIANPGLIGEIRGQGAMDMQTFKQFHDCLAENYGQIMSGEKDVLFKMKELWFYMTKSFEAPERCLKKIKKAKYVDEYRAAAEEMFCYNKTV